MNGPIRLRQGIFRPAGGEMLCQVSDRATRSYYSMLVSRGAAGALSSVDFFVGSHWNAVSGTGSGCHSSAVFSALERAADAQKRVPTIKSLHLRAVGAGCSCKLHLLIRDECLDR